MIAPDSNTQSASACSSPARREFWIWIDFHEATTELLTFADVDRVGIILGASVPKIKKLLQKRSHFDTVGGRERVKLQRVITPRQLFIVSRPCNGPIYVGEAPTTFVIPFPDLGCTYSSAEFDLSSLMVTPWLCVYMYAVKKSASYARPAI